MPAPIIIAIDGHSSCGKSTLARDLADKLGFTYIDSGAMYRAVTLYLIRNAIDPDDREAVAAAMNGIRIELKNGPAGSKVWLNGEDVSEPIREMPVSNMVSRVSMLPEVRRKLVALQQKMGERDNLVMDGRDIGTVVFPHASLKIFMTARPEIRARRRHRELLEKGINISLEEVLENLRKRDLEDSTRKESPLVKAPDAVVLDSSGLSREEQLRWVLEKITGKAGLTI